MSLKSRKLYLLTFLLIYVGVFLTACVENNEPESKELMSIKINELITTIEVGETVELTVTKDPIEADDVLVWESSNPNVATVCECGKVSGISKGTVTIYVRNEKTTVFDAIQITVTQEDGPVDPDPTYYTNSIIKSRTGADPSIIRHEGVFYLFLTGVNSKIMTSTDLINWEYSDVHPLEGRPTWATHNAGVWAPDITKIGDQFIMYYSASVWDDPNPGVGFATAPHPLGPWTDHGKMFLSLEIGVNNSIDPAVFVGQDGKVYMIWGSFRGIYGIELTSDGMALKGGIEYAKNNKVLLAGNDTSTPWDGSTYEGPYVIFRNGYYYLFLSTGLCCEGLNSTYAVRVARSTSPLGPYRDSQGRDMLAGDRGHKVLDGTSRMVGPGHNSIVTDDAGDDWILYHVWDFSDLTNVPASRTTAIDKLIWDQNGWPATQYGIPSIRAVVPFINSTLED